MSVVREAIRELLKSHPEIFPSKAGHTVHLERYRTTGNVNIGFEPDRINHQNLYVEAAAVRLTNLIDIQHRLYLACNYHISRPNHHLFHKHAFAEVDILRFQIHELWQAVRVITEVAGTGSRL